MAVTTMAIPQEEMRIILKNTIPMLQVAASFKALENPHLPPTPWIAWVTLKERARGKRQLEECGVIQAFPFNVSLGMLATLSCHQSFTTNEDGQLYNTKGKVSSMQLQGRGANVLYRLYMC